MEYEEVSKNLGLTPEQIEENTSWINMLSIGTKVSADEITKLFSERVSEAIQAGVHKEFGYESFMEFVKSTVSGDVSQILPPAPGIPIEFMPFGYFPQRMSKFGAQANLRSDIIGWGKLEDSRGIETTTVSASGPNDIFKRNLINPFAVYSTLVSFDPKKKIQNMIRSYMHKETVFDSNVLNPEYMPVNLPDRYKAVVSQYPVTTLANSPSNLSKLIQSDTGRGKKSNPYVDRTDLKVIQVVIKEFQAGRREDGAEWGRLEVTDSSFVSTPSHKSFTVWVDPSLVRKVGAGQGSFVKIIGTIEFDQKQYAQMTACSIIPEKLRPLIEQAPSLSGNTTGPITQEAAGASKVINIAL